MTSFFRVEITLNLDLTTNYRGFVVKSAFNIWLVAMWREYKMKKGLTHLSGKRASVFVYKPHLGSIVLFLFSLYKNNKMYI